MSATRRYLVTGGTSGIGSAVAAHLTGAGHHVWVTGTRADTVAGALADGIAEGVRIRAGQALMRLPPSSDMNDANKVTNSVAPPRPLA